jgi:hypothetical protein
VQVSAVAKTEGLPSDFGTVHEVGLILSTALKFCTTVMLSQGRNCNIISLLVMGHGMLFLLGVMEIDLLRK